MAFLCPNCDSSNTGTAPYLRRKGYTRCSYCRMGIEWKSGFFSDEVTPVGTYIPESSLVSPKTGRVLDPETAYKFPELGFLRTLLLRIFLKNPEKRKKQEGELREDPDRH